MSPSPQALEHSLFKVIKFSPSLLNDRDAFEQVVQPVFDKASAIKAMRQYLVGSASCPRILGALVYATQGHAEIKDWLSMGMPIRLLYQCMLYDGGPWAKIGAQLPLADTIIHGGPEWDFDYKLLNGLDPTTATPGLVDAVLRRAMHQGHEQSLVKALSLETLELLIQGYSVALAPLIVKARKVLGEDSGIVNVADLAQAVLKATLAPVESIQKVLLRHAY
ncbi:hypothetical protein RBE51_18455 [Pseudomonas taiwanensis]|uniref:hypothetical protein n=1 Tax=Pseudomonas taiwanensis TaxID=470150 RepID=UPI0028DF0152|nr:hypothetical protein [Pseudomonas taiwanensis]MDT8924778.1 hypothetical protein [Pseudomonas taiwanensis]